MVLMLPYTEAAVALVRQQPPVLPQHTFTAGNDGWLAVGDVAKVTRTTDPRPALQFEYTIDKRSLGFLARPFEAGQLAGAKRLRFVVKTDTDTTLAFLVAEKGGGRWTAIATVAKGVWQEVELAPSDFTLGRDANDPKDDNEKLDLEKAESVSVFDVHTFLIRTENPDLSKLFAVSAGPRTLWLSAFSASDTPLAPATLDGLSRPQLGWTAVGGVDLTRTTTGSPLPGTALSVQYAVGSGKVGALFRPLPTGSLAGKTSLSLTAAVLKSTSLVIQIEDDWGAKVNATIDIPGIRVPKKFTLALADFKRSEDSKRDKIDLSRVKQIVVLDITGLTEAVEQINTLWLANLEAK